MFKENKEMVRIESYNNILEEVVEFINEFKLKGSFEYSKDFSKQEIVEKDIQNMIKELESLDFVNFTPVMIRIV